MAYGTWHSLDSTNGGQKPIVSDDKMYCYAQAIQIGVRYTSGGGSEGPKSYNAAPWYAWDFDFKWRRNGVLQTFNLNGWLTIYMSETGGVVAGGQVVYANNWAAGAIEQWNGQMIQSGTMSPVDMSNTIWRACGQAHFLSGDDYWDLIEFNTSPVSYYFGNSTDDRDKSHFIFVIWERVVNVTYNANGGNGSPETQTIGPADSLLTTSFTRSDWVISGWNTAADGSGTAIALDALGSTVINAAGGNNTITLYAQWRRVKYELTFDTLFVLWQWLWSSSHAIQGGTTGDRADIVLGGNDWPMIYSGNHQHIFTAYGTGNGYYNIPVEAGVSYTFTCLVAKWDDYALPANLGAQVYYVPMTSDYQYVRASESQKYVALGSAVKATSGATSISYTATFTPPTNCAYVQLFFDIHDENSGAKFTNIRLRKTDPYAQTTVTKTRQNYAWQSGKTYAQLISTNPVLATASRIGYNFNGWYTAETGGTRVTASTTAAMADTVLYSRWTGIYYELTFDNQFALYEWLRSPSYALSKDTYSTDPQPILAQYNGWPGIYSGGNEHVYTKYGTGSGYCNIPVEAGVTYKFKCRISAFTNGGTTYPLPDDKGAQVFYVPMTSAYDYVRASETQKYVALGSAIKFASGETAKTYEATFTAPANCAYVQLFFDVHDAGRGATFTQIRLCKNSPYGDVSPSKVRQAYQYQANKTYAQIINASPVLATATRTGYTFSGWYTAEAGGSAVTDNTTAAAAITKLYSRWTANTYRVTFGKNGGTGGDDYVTATYGQPMPTPRTAPTKTGYIFDGYWSTVYEGGVEYYDANMQSVHNWDIAAERTIWAKWIAKTSALTFNANGGSGTMTTGKVATYGEAMPTGITLPTRTGYTFNGFYDATSGGTKYYNADGTSARSWDKNKTSGTTLYAQWITRTSLTLVLGSHITAVYYKTANQSSYTEITEETAIELDEGTTWMGYATASTGYLPNNGSGNPITSTKGATAESVTFNAYAKTSALTFNANGGSGTMTTGLTATYGQAMPTPVNLPTRVGYAFNGFYDATDGGTKYYNANGTSARSWNKNKTSGTTLYAQWKKCADLYFYTNGGQGTMPTGMQAYKGEAMPTFPSASLPTRSGYTFVGFFTATIGGVQYYNANGTSARNWDSDANTLQLFAQWRSLLVSVLFDPNGGTLAGGDFFRQVSYGLAYGSASNPLPSPTRIGYTFLSWNTALDGSGSTISANTICTTYADQVLYAQWTVYQPTTITVSFNPEGGTCGTTSVVKTIGSAYGSMPTATRTDYTFNGWFTLPEGGTAITSSSIVGSDDIVLYAQWTYSGVIPVDPPVIVDWWDVVLT